MTVVVDALVAGFTITTGIIAIEKYAHKNGRTENCGRPNFLSLSVAVKAWNTPCTDLGS
jgi:hypothetical protein